MYDIFYRTLKSISLSALILIAIGVSYMDSQAKDASLTQATFYVYWYDVGKSALEGLKGVKKVENGWHNSKEINRVYYDPAAVSIDDMEAALEKAKTYQGTAGVAEDKWPGEAQSAFQPTRDLIRFQLYGFYIVLHIIYELRYNAIYMSLFRVNIEM